MALLIEESAVRARLWAEEARLERIRLYRAAWKDPDVIRPWYSETFDGSYDQQNATNAFRSFIRVRFHKFHRARARRYERLKYLYELQHPPFATPEFPEHPSMTLWNAPFDLQPTGWGAPTSKQKEPALMTPEDDELSPFLTTVSLPPA
ncbi:hypothetical protein C8R47DRAFT_1205115 [Mycena vitilis]|nr:hypothetical protein C8R47DRAFT_1205115 [Mycena vitilis]